MLALPTSAALEKSTKKWGGEASLNLGTFRGWKADAGFWFIVNKFLIKSVFVGRIELILILLKFWSFRAKTWNVLIEKVDWQSKELLQCFPKLFNLSPLPVSFSPSILLTLYLSPSYSCTHFSLFLLTHTTTKNTYGRVFLSFSVFFWYMYV